LKWGGIVAEFKYVVPRSVHEAIALISEYGEKAGVIAGGTDLLAKMKKGLGMPEVLVNIECIPELNYIEHNVAEGLSIGAATPLSALERSAVIQSKFPVLTQVVGLMASPIIRNRATIGGNICNAAPSADIVPALIVLEAKVVIVGKDGERVIPLEEFFAGPGQTVIQPGQFLKEILVPEMPAGSSAFISSIKEREPIWQ
jgi:carbon-monoxide dehydrogenase medium subunit